MTRWRALVVVMSVGILTAGHSALRAQRPRPAAPPTPTPAAVPVPPKPPSVRAWLDADQIPEGGTVKVWIVIDNQKLQSLEDVRFDALELHGFDRAPGCWRDSTPSCPAGSNGSDSQDSIAGSTQLVRWAEFKRVQKDNGRSALFGSLRWTNSATKANSHTTISLPAVQLVSATRPLSTTELLAFITLFGTLITVSVQWLMQRRAERQALFTTLLPKNLKNAESYYLPVQSTINQMVALADSAPVPLEQLTFYWLLFSRRMRQVQQKAGGFYFKSYVGEELAAAAWDEFKTQEIRQDSAPVHPISTRLMFQTVGRLESTSNFGDFSAKRSTTATFDADVIALQSGLVQWLSTESWTFAVTCASVLDTVLAFEINRPHEKWYVDSYPKEKGRESLNKLIEALRGLTLGGDAEDLKNRDKLVGFVQGYLDRRWSDGGLAG